MEILDYLQCARNAAACMKILFDAYVSEGFTEEQALELVKTQVIEAAKSNNGD